MKTQKYILVIDDDADDCFFLNQAISKLNQPIEVTMLKDGIEAMNYLEEEFTENVKNQKPDLIFLDLNMALLDGVTTAKIIKRSEDLRNIPLIIMTTSTSNKDRETMAQIGVDGYYIKPTSLQDLEIIVKELSDKYLV